MADHIWSVVCRSAIIDRYTNTVSLLNIIESAEFSPDQPISEGKEWHNLQSDAFIVSYLIRSDLEQPEQCQIRVKVVAPDGTKNDKEIIIEADLSEHARFRGIFHLKGLPFWSSGVHWFYVALKNDGRWKEISRIPITITQKSPEE